MIFAGYQSAGTRGRMLDLENDLDISPAIQEKLVRLFPAPGQGCT